MTKYTAQPGPNGGWRVLLWNRYHIAHFASRDEANAYVEKRVPTRVLTVLH